jgi:hypothetical protein
MRKKIKQKRERELFYQQMDTEWRLHQMQRRLQWVDEDAEEKELRSEV